MMMTSEIAMGVIDAFRFLIEASSLLTSPGIYAWVSNAAPSPLRPFRGTTFANMRFGVFPDRKSP
jgi:hypothetical protein